MTGFQLARISLARRPFPTLLAVFCITLACLAADLMISITRGKSSSLLRLESEYDLIMGAKSSGTELLLGAFGRGAVPSNVIPYALVEYLDRQGDLQHRIPIYVVGFHQGIRVIGADDSWWSRPDNFRGPILAEGGLPSASDEVVVGERAARELALRIGDSLKLEIPRSDEKGKDLLWTDEVRVVGVARHDDPAMDRCILMTLDRSWIHYRWALGLGVSQPTKNEKAISYALLSTQQGRIEKVETKIHEQSTVQVVQVREELDYLKGLVRGAVQTTNLLTLLILLMVVLAVTVLVNSRFDSLKQELGVLRALGYTRGEIGSWLMLESILPVSAAVCLTICIETLCFPRLSGLWDTGWLESEPALWPAAWNMAVWVLFILAAFAAAALPIYRLYRTDVREAMEGV